MTEYSKGLRNNTHANYGKLEKRNQEESEMGKAMPLGHYARTLFART